MVDNLKIMINNNEYYFVPNKFFVNLFNSIYCISKEGELINNRTKKFIKVNDNGDGYKQYVIKNGGFVSKFYIHRVLADLFIENPNNYNEVDHIDRIKSNNNLDNLRWVSRKENLENRGYRLFSNISINFNKFVTNVKKKRYSSNKLSNILDYRYDNLLIAEQNLSFCSKFECDGVVYYRTNKNISFNDIMKYCDEMNVCPREVIIKKDKFIIYNFIPNGDEEYIEYENRLYILNKMNENLKYEIQNNKLSI